ncbi:MAG TPA: hypothetical protein VK674_01585 [Candidatus Limnocylindria bacterium]|nr:hypothetical protein [Candidatus Limnocylindria bacterium]
MPMFDCGESPFGELGKAERQLTVFLPELSQDNESPFQSDFLGPHAFLDASPDILFGTDSRPFPKPYDIIETTATEEPSEHRSP